MEPVVSSKQVAILADYLIHAKGGVRGAIRFIETQVDSSWPDWAAYCDARRLLEQRLP